MVWCPFWQSLSAAISCSMDDPPFWSMCYWVRIHTFFFLYLYLKNRFNSYHPTTCGYSYNTMHYEILYICFCLLLRVSLNGWYPAWAFVFGMEFVRDWLSKLILGFVCLRFLNTPHFTFFSSIMWTRLTCKCGRIIFVAEILHLLGLMLIYFAEDPAPEMVVLLMNLKPFLYLCGHGNALIYFWGDIFFGFLMVNCYSPLLLLTSSSLPFWGR